MRRVRDRSWTLQWVTAFVAFATIASGVTAILSAHDPNTPSSPAPQSGQDLTAYVPGPPPGFTAVSLDLNDTSALSGLVAAHTQELFQMAGFMAGQITLWRSATGAQTTILVVEFASEDSRSRAQNAFTSIVSTSAGAEPINDEIDFTHPNDAGLLERAGFVGRHRRLAVILSEAATTADLGVLRTAATELASRL